MNKSEKLGSKEELLPQNKASSRMRQFKWAIFFFVFFQMVIFAVYVVFYMTPKTWDMIGLPILIARGSAYGACFWTAVLFLTMSRDLISFIARIPMVRKSETLMQLLNCSKELHVFAAVELTLDGCVHALMHHIGTFVALQRHTSKQLNAVLVCAQDPADMPNGYLGKFIPFFLKVFQYPACPLPEGGHMGYWTGVLSTPGITGYLLMLVIFALGYFSRRSARQTNFRRFFALHHLLVPMWVILLVVHGANDWVGLGFPLILLVAGIPMVIYGYSRLRRTYLSLQRTAAKVVAAEKSSTNRLLRLEVELAPGMYRQCQVGEFAYINVPSLARMEWHPFTISRCQTMESGAQVLTFCIMGVGTWTKALSSLFDDANARPVIHIDGPFYAPTVSMPSRSTVVGIGSGVGVTPFLSFLGSMASAGEEGRHKSAHVFWTSPWATDFLLFRDLLGQVDKRTASGGCSTTFHLHATPRSRNGPWNGKGLGCVFELATKEVWESWKVRCANRASEMVPVFCKYPKPIHGVVSNAVLDSKKPISVAVGSPDFTTELLAIGDADSDEDVFVYYCGNPYLQKTVQHACIACNEQREAQGRSQRYYFYFERFG
jgi:predicted ferric reductase